MFPAAAAQPPLISTFFEHLVNRVCDFYEKNPTCCVITAIALGTIGMMASMFFFASIPGLLSFTFLSVVPGSFAEFVVVELGIILAEFTIGLEIVSILIVSCKDLKTSHHILLLIASIALVALVALGIFIISSLPALSLSLLTQVIFITLVSSVISTGTSAVSLATSGIIKLIW